MEFYKKDSLVVDKGGIWHEGKQIIGINDIESYRIVYKPRIISRTLFFIGILMLLVQLLYHMFDLLFTILAIIFIFTTVRKEWIVEVYIMNNGARLFSFSSRDEACSFYRAISEAKKSIGH